MANDSQTFSLRDTINNLTLSDFNDPDEHFFDDNLSETLTLPEDKIKSFKHRLQFFYTN